MHGDWPATPVATGVTDTLSRARTRDDQHRFEPQDNLLRATRRSRGLSAEYVARSLGVHRMTVTRWERRERLPGGDHVTRLANLLELDRRELTAFFDAVRPPSAGLGPARGHGLRALRRRASIPVRRLAEQLQVNSARIYGWESGTVPIPRHHLPKIAAELGLAPTELEHRLRPMPATAEGGVSAPSRLERIRRRAGLTKTQVAKRVRVHPSTISKWERGAAPPLVMLRRLARVYGLSTGVLAEAAGVRPPRVLAPSRWTSGDLPDVIRAFRAWHGLTQSEIAALVGRDVGQIQRWEAGRAVPSVATLKALNAALGLPAGELLRIPWARRG